MMPTKDTSWMASAACEGVDVNRFFPGKGQRTDVVKEYCAGCPVRSECLDYALTNESAGGYHHYGIYGGLGPAERKRISVWRNKKGQRVTKQPMRDDGGTVPVPEPRTGIVRARTGT